MTVSLSTASEPPAGPPVGPGKRGRCGRSTALAFLRATACYSVGMPSPPSFLSPLSLSSFFSPHYTRVYIRLFPKFSLLFFIIPFFSYSFTHVSLLSLVCSLCVVVSVIVISTVQVTHIKRWGGEGRGGERRVKGEEIFSYISGINTPSPCTVVKSTEWIEREKKTQVQTCVYACVCVCVFSHRACTSLERKRGLQG